MMSKRGMLLVEETLKMIIAVIAIGFLIYFLVSLYFTRVQGNELNQANADINLLNNAIKAGTPSETLNNPVGWYLFSFIEGKKPNACVNENCLCICDKVYYKTYFGFGEDRQFTECNKNGACIGF